MHFKKRMKQSLILTIAVIALMGTTVYIRDNHLPEVFTAYADKPQTVEVPVVFTKIERVPEAAERTYSMKPWVWKLCKDWGNQYNVPREVWYPIIMMESKGNPVSTMVTKKEDSRGLLQVNTKVHKVNKLDMYNPEKNLEFQMPTLSKYYKEAKSKGLVGLDVVYYVERYGQKCEWTEEVKKSLKKYYMEVMS